MKIIALTAHVTGEQRQRCLDAGMNGYLAKPVKLQALADTLDACSSNRDTPAGNPQLNRSEHSCVELDADALAEIAVLSKATGRNVFRKLADNFLSELAGRLVLITDALESINMSQLASLVHPLKSASAIIGAKQFSEICAKVEQFASDGKAEQAISLAREMLEAARVLPDALLGAAGYQ